jgi:hypothetical protein
MYYLAHYGVFVAEIDLLRLIRPYPHYVDYGILLLLSPSPVARRLVVLLTFLLNRGTQKADIRPVYSL